MRIHNVFVLLALAAMLAWGTGASDEPVKVGVVDVDQAFNSSVDGKAAREELARKKREAEGSVEPLIERYQKLEEDLQAKRFVLSDEALYQKQLDLNEMRNQIQNKLKELEGQLQIDQARLEGPLKKKLLEIIDDTGKDAGFTIIFARGAPGVLYTREALDITDKVIEKYNQKG